MGIKNIKREAISSVLLIFLLMVLSTAARSEDELNFIQRFSIKMKSGMSHIGVGDINNHLESGNERDSDYAQYWLNGLKKGELKKIEDGSKSELELSFAVSSRFGVYLSAGYDYARKESSGGFEVYPRPRFLPDVDFVDFTFSPTVSIRVIPLRLGLYYIIPFGSKARLSINGGGGYFITKTVFFWEQIEIWKREDGSIAGDFKEVVEWDLSSKAIGFHGGIGFEYNLTKSLSLVIEYQGRSARLKELKGTEIVVGLDYTESFYGAVYYFEMKNWITEKYYIGLGFFEEKPDYLPSTRYRNIRNAELDLSGHSLVVGMKISLF